MRSPGPLGFFAPEDCTIERQVFADPECQATFEEQGYVVMPFIDAQEVATLVEGYDDLSAELGGSSDPADYNDTFAEFSIIHSRPDFRRRAYDLITEVLVPVADRHLLAHRPLIANYVNKPPGTGVVPTHQNFSVVDETRFRSVSVWVALVDCVLDNGAMSMLDGSHVALRSRRGMWAYQAFGQISQDELDPLLTPVEVPAGHAVILDDAMVHYSPPNQTAERRLAIQFVMVPDDATPLWFQQIGASDDGLDIAVWEVTEQFFFDFWHGDGDARHATRADDITLPQADLDLGGLQRLLGHRGDETTPDGPDAEAADLTGSGPTDVAAASDEAAPADEVGDPDSAPARAQRGLRALISRLSR